MKSKMVLALALFGLNTYAMEFGEEELGGTVFQKVTLRSSELEERVTNDLFRLMGMSGRTINGEQKRLFPLLLAQGFKKSNGTIQSPNFPLEATIHFQNNEVRETKRGLVLTGRVAYFLRDLLENNFFNLKIKTRITDRYEVFYNSISCFEVIHRKGETPRPTCIFDIYRTR